ncbi:MAG: DUF975 family protein [Lachnospiraceae bacterium]|nr:DUF975 family protein [Lachnospiraceae bacterium]
MMTNKEIRCLARETLHGKFSSFITLFLCAYIIETLIVSLPSSFLAAPKNLPLYLSQVLLSILLEALGSMIMLSINRGALQLIRGHKTSLADIFFAFRNQADHFLALELFFTIIHTLTSIPIYVYVWITRDSEMSLLTYAITSNMLSAVATGLTILITLIFSMSEFLMLDDPSLTAREALRKSTDLINGSTGQYFLLLLSFLGYIVLGFTSATIGFLWVVPYITVSQAIFYEKLKES